eukprot:5678644-Prymnesium_polylepis.2
MRRYRASAPRASCPPLAPHRGWYERAHLRDRYGRARRLLGSAFPGLVKGEQLDVWVFSQQPFHERIELWRAARFGVDGRSDTLRCSR